MKKALLISNRSFDDPGGRAEKFLTRKRLLAERGWEIVLGHVPEPYLVTFLPSLVRCYRTAIAEDVEVVISVSNPFHLQVVGFVVSELAGVPWVAEFRDPMVENPDRDPDELTTKLAGIVESLIVRRSDQVIWGDGIQMEDDYFASEYPDAPKDKFFKLPYIGFEAEKFDRAESASYDRFVMTYAGSFYEGFIEPYALLDGVAAYVKDNDVSPNDFVVQFYGSWSTDYQEYADRLSVTDYVTHHDFVPHEEIVPVLKGSDCLVYIGGTDRENERNVPSKIADYAGAGRPVLGIVDEEFRASETIESENLGVVADPDNPDAIAAAIAELETGEFEYERGDLPDYFTRSYKMDVLADVLDAVESGDMYDPGVHAERATEVVNDI